MAGITGIAGLPGAGKSYTAVELFLLPALKENRPVVTNLPLQLEVINAEFPKANIKHVEVDEFEWDLKNLPPGCLLLLDEVWKLWPQGKQLKNIPVPEMAVLKEHRHHSDENGRSMDVVLISQDMNDLSKPVRDLVEATILNIKHLDLGREDVFIRWFCKKACSVDKTGSPPANQVNSSENVKYKADVYKYYKTHMHGSASAAGPNEKRIVSSSIFGSFRFKAAVVIVLVCIGLMIRGISETKDNIDKATTKKTPKSVSKHIEPAGTVPGSKEVKPTTATVHYSTSWKIAGIFYNFGGTGHDRFILSNSAKQLRHVDGKQCRKQDYEYYCDVDGEIVTFFSGSGSSGATPLPNSQS